MKVSDLYNDDGPLIGHDVYIVGSGPSLRVFPVDFLKGRCCILLNTAHRILPGLGPVAFSNNLDFLAPKGKLHPACECEYKVIKGRLKWEWISRPWENADNHVDWDDPRYYVFSYREPKMEHAKTGEVMSTGDTWSHYDDCALWKEPDFYWNVRKGTVAIFAVQFALLAGAKSITLIGCDCCDFGERKFASSHNAGPVNMVHNYEQYAAGLNRLAKEARERFGVPLLHLSPFPGYGREQQQYLEFLKWGDNGWT